VATEQNKALVRRFADLVNAHDLDSAFALCSSDFVDHALPPGTPQGVEGSRQFFLGTFAALPDAHGTFLNMVAEGDLVASQMEIEGTHEGSLMDVPATGKQLKWTQMDFHRIADGKIAEHWTESDMMGLMQQLGVPSPNAA